MLVKMRREISGLRDGQPWPPVGGTIELPDDEAVGLVANRIAEPVYDPEHGIETAVAPPPELRDVVVESDGSVDTSARDALVPSSTKRTRQRPR